MKRCFFFQEALETIPDDFGAPILYLVHILSFRGRLDDLVNDIYLFIKERYFVGEKCVYTGERRKKTVRILSVSFTGADFTAPSSVEADDESAKSNEEYDFIFFFQKLSFVCSNKKILHLRFYLNANCNIYCFFFKLLSFFFLTVW